MQGPSKEWEKLLLSLDVSGSEAGIEGEEIAPLSKENVPTPWAERVVWWVCIDMKKANAKLSTLSTVDREPFALLGAGVAQMLVEG